MDGEQANWLDPAQWDTAARAGLLRGTLQPGIYVVFVEPEKAVAVNIHEDGTTTVGVDPRNR